MECLSWRRRTSNGRPSLPGSDRDLASRPQIELRQVDWLNSIADSLSKLEERVDEFQIESLARDPEFTSAMLQASAIAIRNHDEEKLEALRNAVLNTAVRTNDSNDEHALFISLIDTVTPWHLRILAFLRDKEAIRSKRDKLPFPDWSMGGVSTVLGHVYPELSGRRSFYDLIVTDLNRAGLATIDSLHVTGTRAGYMLAKQTTDLGDPHPPSD